MSQRLIDIIAIIIVVAWVVSFMLSATMNSYNPPEGLHGLMLLVAGAAFTGSVVKRNGNGKETK